MKKAQNNGIPTVIIVPNFITKKDCDAFIKIGNSQEQRKEEFGADEGRYSHIADITPCKNVPLYLKIQNKLHLLNDKHFQFKLKREIGIAGFLRYDVGGFTGWHYDGAIGNEYPERKLSAVIMLSEQGTDYNGGHFDFPFYSALTGKQRNEVMKKGTLVLFPAFLYHEVSKVTEGKRYTLAYFLQGPKFR